MKMYLDGKSVNSLHIIKHDIDTNSATMVASDLQAGITCFARGQKITGTGKSFEFANYGHLDTNLSRYVPTDINVIEIASTEYPIKSNINMTSVNSVDFSNEQLIGTVIINGTEYDLVASVKSNIMKITCDETIRLQIFYGKDNYV